MVFLNYGIIIINIYFHFWYSVNAQYIPANTFLIKSTTSVNSYASITKLLHCSEVCHNYSSAIVVLIAEQSIVSSTHSQLTQVH